MSTMPMKKENIISSENISKTLNDIKQGIPIINGDTNLNNSFSLGSNPSNNTYEENTEVLIKLFGTNSSDYKNDDLAVIDEEWVTSRFMVADKDLEEMHRVNRYFTKAGWKFTDTRLGHSIEANPAYQFCRFADMRGATRSIRNPTTVNYSTNLGMGRYYSEAIDDHKQLLFLEFGVPKFNSLITFFTRAIDYEDAYIAKTGRLPFGYTLGNIIGATAAFIAFPFVSILTYGVKAITYMLNVIGNNNFSYYYLEPTIHTYWYSVNTILSLMTVELGLLHPSFMPGKKIDLTEDTGGNFPDDEFIQAEGSKYRSPKRIGTPFQLDNYDLSVLRASLPDLLTEGNYVNAFAIATRAQRAANMQFLEENALYEKSKENSFNGMVYDENTEEYDMGLLKKAFRTINSTIMFGIYTRNNSGEIEKVVNPGIAAVVTAADGLFGQKEEIVQDNPAIKSSVATNEEGNVDANATVDAATNAKKEDVFTKDNSGYLPVDESAGKPFSESPLSYYNKYAQTLDSVVRDGGRWAIFKVKYVGTVNESFSNSVGDIQTEGMIKQIGGAANELRYNLAGGQISDFIGGIVDTVKNVAVGALNGATFGLAGVIGGLLSGGYINLPKKWEDSDISLPNITYSIELRSPYGNSFSQIQDIYFPLAMLMAGALPLSAGKASYASPFLCNAFCRGVQNIKLGMITSLSIERGTGNLGFSKEWRPLGMDVQFTITDFSSIMTAPINKSVFESALISLEEDTPLGSYIATMCGRDIVFNRYKMPMWKQRLSRLNNAVEQGFAPENITMWFTGSGVGGMVSKFLGGFAADSSLVGDGTINNQ